MSQLPILALFRPWITGELIQSLNEKFPGRFYDLSHFESPEQFRTCLRSAIMADKAILVTNSEFVRRLMRDEKCFDYILVYPFVKTDFERKPHKNSYLLRQVYDCRNDTGCVHQEIKDAANLDIDYHIHHGWMIAEK